MDVQQEDQPQREADERLMQHLLVMDPLTHSNFKSINATGTSVQHPRLVEATDPSCLPLQLPLRWPWAGDRGQAHLSFHRGMTSSREDLRPSFHTWAQHTTYEMLGSTINRMVSPELLSHAVKLDVGQAPRDPRGIHGEYLV